MKSFTLTTIISISIYILDNVTLLAPTNDAIGDADGLEAMVDSLTYHLINTSVGSDDIRNEFQVTSFSGLEIRVNIYNEEQVSTEIFTQITLQHSNRRFSSPS